jgi:hypothetical protein
MMTAEAAGEEQKGLAEVKVKEADAIAVEKQGQAEAAAIRVKMEAEAAGLTEKIQAMKALDGPSREHEEFRIRLDKDKEIELAEIDMRKDIAEKQAKVMSEAMGKAKINIVGGDGQFLEKFFNAVSMGHAVDGAIDNSEVLKGALSDYLEGKANFREDVKGILTESSISSETVKNLSVAAALRQLSSGMDPSKREAVERLIDQARQLGLS